MQDDQQDAGTALHQDPPTSLRGILSKLGPGLIIAGSIVGSGELIATTSTGAKAGFTLLWLILIGCVIKVFVQVEFGRYTITTGITSIKGLSRLPGPRIGRGNWFIWYWFIMFIFVMGQLGGIVGGVGQAISISMPITDYGKLHNEFREAETVLGVTRAHYAMESTPASRSELQFRIVNNEIVSVTAYSQLEPLSSDAALPSAQDAEALFRPLLRPGLTDVEQYVVTNLLPDHSLREGAELRSKMYFAGSSFTALEKEQFAKEVNGIRTNLVEKARFHFSAAVSADTDIVDLSPAILTNIAGVKSFIDYYNDLYMRPPIHGAKDHFIYAAALTIITIALLVIGRYSFIQTFSTVLVALFTLVTILNVFGLQTMDSAVAWKIQWSELKDGLSFGLGKGDWKDNLGFALATFGIIGVGAAELIAYPYWCMEHGYAKFTGVRDDSSEWGVRARGWIRVLRWDAWCSAAIYTFATIAFYLLGAAILGRINLIPAGDDMVRSLSVMYRPVFGPIAESIFLFGAVAVLYSTFFVASAGNARMLSDVFRTLGWISNTELAYRRSVRWMCAILPAICGITYILGVKPVVAVIMSGVMQSIMLPMLGGAAIYFRYKFCDDRVKPNRVTDMFVIISAIGLLIAGGFAAYTKIATSF